MFSLPLHCLDTLAGSLWFSKLDMNSTCWQVGIKEEDGETVFISKYGLFGLGSVMNRCIDLAMGRSERKTVVFMTSQG